MNSKASAARRRQVIDVDLERPVGDAVEVEMLRLRQGSRKRPGMTALVLRS